MKEDIMVKVHVDLPNHWAVGGESMWATPMGEELYRLENVPFYAYGLNYHDIVRATSDSDELIPEIIRLIEPSGYRTFRMFFQKQIDSDQRQETFDTLAELSVYYERATNNFFSLNMSPEGNYEAVNDKLEQLVQQNILEFETCEARTEGSFDDLPGGDE